VVYGYASQTDAADHQNVGVLGVARGTSFSYGYSAGVMGIGDYNNAWYATGVYAGLGSGAATIPTVSTAFYANGANLGYAGIFMGGNVGIGTPIPAYKLDVNGDVRISGDLNVGGKIYGWNVPSSVVVTSWYHNGNFGGYRGMYNYLQDNGYSGYHVCDGIEISRWLQAGNTLPLTVGYGCWVSNGIYVNVGGTILEDCYGWAYSGGGYGPVWVNEGGTLHPIWGDCALSKQVCACK